jgi:ribose transport system permease protein
MHDLEVVASKSWLRAVVAQRQWQFVLPVVILIAIFSAQEPMILSWANIRNICIQTSYLLILTVAQSLVLLTRGFDLSIGMAVSLVSVISALTMKYSGASSPVLAIGLGVASGLLVGAVIGAVNGALVAFANINPFIVTLGTFNALLALSSTVSGGFPVAGLPEGLTTVFAQGDILGTPVPVIFAAVILVGAHFALKRTVFGRSLYLIGSNRRAAVVAGISVRLHLISAYVVCSVLAAIGAILLTARTSSGEPNLGGSLALQTIAAAVIGGLRLRGGEGGAMSALLGSLFVTVLSNGMDLLRVDGYLQQVWIGPAIVLSLIIDRYSDRRERRE